jgi:uncharacterized protein with GYD domain
MAIDGRRVFDWDEGAIDRRFALRPAAFGVAAGGPSFRETVALLELPAKSVLAGSMAALLYGAPVLFAVKIFSGFGSRVFAALLGTAARELGDDGLGAEALAAPARAALGPRRPAALEVVPHYVSLMRWTSKGVAGLPAWRERVEEGERIVEEAGGSLVGVYVTLGRYDVVEIFEAPDDDTAAEILMKLQRHGAEHTETLRAFTRDEAEAIVKRL